MLLASTRRALRQQERQARKERLTPTAAAAPQPASQPASSAMRVVSAPSFQPIKGAPPSIEFRPIADLHVDTSYQRSLGGRESQAIIRAIAADFDWRLCAPLTVSRRTGDVGGDRFFVIDGQHRLEGARLRGDVAFLPCIITSYASAAEEAELFVAVNQRRRRVTALETFRAAVVAGDATARETAELIGFAGLSVPALNSPSSWAPNELGQVVTVMKGLRRHGRDVTIACLRLLAEAFPDERLEQAGRLLDGLFLIEAEPPAGYDRDRLFRSLLIRDQGQWAAAAMTRMAITQSEGWAGAMRAVMLDLYHASEQQEAA